MRNNSSDIHNLTLNGDRSEGSATPLTFDKNNRKRGNETGNGHKERSQEVFMIDSLNRLSTIEKNRLWASNQLLSLIYLAKLRTHSVRPQGSPGAASAKVAPDWYHSFSDVTYFQIPTKRIEPIL